MIDQQCTVKIEYESKYLIVIIATKYPDFAYCTYKYLSFPFFKNIRLIEKKFQQELQSRINNNIELNITESLVLHILSKTTNGMAYFKGSDLINNVIIEVRYDGEWYATDVASFQYTKCLKPYRCNENDLFILHTPIPKSKIKLELKNILFNYFMLNMDNPIIPAEAIKYINEHS